MSPGSTWMIVASLAGSAIVSVLVNRWMRSDQNDRDMARFDEKLKARDEILEEKLRGRDQERALEKRLIDHQLQAHDRRLEQLGQRYHDMRGIFLKALRRVGYISRRSDRKDGE